MLKNEGTILISYMNLYEVCKGKFTQYYDQILQMLDGIDFAFSDFNAHNVIESEAKIKRIKILQEYIEPVFPSDLMSAYIYNHDFNKMLSIPEAFNNFRYASQKEFLDSYMDDVINKLNSMTQERTENREDVLRAIKNYTGRKNLIKEKGPFTKTIWFQCLNYLVSHKKAKLRRNDWVDIFHTIVPVAYCDFVLIDGQWRDFIEKSGLTYPKIAKVYSKKKGIENNIDGFFKDIEKYIPNNRESEIGSWSLFETK